MKESHRVPFQDPVAVGGREVKLVEDCGGYSMSLAAKYIRADHDCGRIRPCHEKTERLRIINQIVVMGIDAVIPDGVLIEVLRSSSCDREMLEAPYKVGKGAARMRQENCRYGILSSVPV